MSRKIKVNEFISELSIIGYGYREHEVVGVGYNNSGYYTLHVRDEKGKETVLEIPRYIDEAEKNIARVVYVDWKDRKHEPEIVGIYKKPEDACVARITKEAELERDGHILNEEFHVWVEETEVK